MRFSPGWKLSLTVWLLLPLLLSLGCWQLQRGADKREILQRIETRRSALPLAFGELQSFEDPAYRQVMLRGRYLAEYVVLLDNRIVMGRFGYEWVQLFQLDGGPLVAVSRGWLPGSLRRDEWPTLPSVDGEQLLTAEVYVPLGEPVRLAPEAEAAGWPKRFQVLNIAALAEELDEAIYPYVLRLRSKHPSALLAHWQDINVLPAKHTAYAVQWFAMAAALSLMYLAVGFGWLGSRNESAGNVG